AAADAVRAILIDAAFERRPDALAGHLDDAELRNAQDFRAGPVTLHGVAHRFFDAAPVLLLTHVDEVVDNNTAQVAQTELAGDLLGGLQVHLVGRLLGIVV